MTTRKSAEQAVNEIFEIAIDYFHDPTQDAAKAMQAVCGVFNFGLLAETRPMTRAEIVNAILSDASNRNLFDGIDDDIREQIEASWRKFATDAPYFAPAVDEIRQWRDAFTAAYDALLRLAERMEPHINAPELKREHEELRNYALAITRTLTNLVGGGSEMFSGRIAAGTDRELFKADLPLCEKRIRDRWNNVWDRLLKAPNGWFVETVKHEHTPIRTRDSTHDPIRWIVQFQRRPKGGLLQTGYGATLYEAFENASKNVADIEREERSR